MPDLNILQSSLLSSLVGIDSTGNETNPVNADANGNLQVVAPTAGAVTPGTAATKSELIGGQYNSTSPTLTTGQQTALQVDFSGRLIVGTGGVDSSSFVYGSSNEITVGGVYQDTGGVLTAGQQGAARLTQRRALHTNLRNSSGNELASSLFNGAASLQISFADGPSMDSVGRMRISDVLNIGAYCFYAGTKDLDFSSAITGSATVTFNANTASTRLTTTTSSTDTVIRQTKRYFSYAPGIGHAYGLALTPGVQKTNITQRWGHFDFSDGTFFQQTGSAGLSVVIRTSTSGSPVDTVTLQANWNLDKLDGTGPSGITLNPADHNKFVIDMSWYGAGRVRFGIFYNGQTVYCHQYNAANVSVSPYTRTPKLPLRIELNNTGTTASTTFLDIVCLSVTQEASAPRLPSYNFSKSMGRAGVSVASTLIPLLSIQPTTTFNGITNRSSIIPSNIQGLSNQQAILIQVILNPTLTGASFGPVNTYSCTQFDTSATAFSGGVVLAEFYIPAGNEGFYNFSNFSETCTLSQNIAGTAGDILTIAAISTAGGSTTWANIQWEEAQ